MPRTQQAFLILEINRFFLVCKIRPIDKTNTRMRPTHTGTILFSDGFLFSVAICATSKRRTSYMMNIFVESCYTIAKEKGIHPLSSSIHLKLDFQRKRNKTKFNGEKKNETTH